MLFVFQDYVCSVGMLTDVRFQPKLRGRTRVLQGVDFGRAGLDETAGSAGQPMVVLLVSLFFGDREFVSGCDSICLCPLFF